MRTITPAIFDLLHSSRHWGQAPRALAQPRAGHAEELHPLTYVAWGGSLLSFSCWPYLSPLLYVVCVLCVVAGVHRAGRTERKTVLTAIFLCALQALFWLIVEVNYLLATHGERLWGALERAL